MLDYTYSNNNCTYFNKIVIVQICGKIVSYVLFFETIKESFLYSSELTGG